MGRITLREAIEWYDKELSARQFVDEQLRDMACLILAAAKAFACERCGGTGWVFGEPERGHRKMLDCPASHSSIMTKDRGMENLSDYTMMILAEKLAARDETVTNLRRDLLLAKSPPDDGTRMIVASICPKCLKPEMIPIVGHSLTGEDDPDIEICEDCLDRCER